MDKSVQSNITLWEVTTRAYCTGGVTVAGTKGGTRKGRRDFMQPSGSWPVDKLPTREDSTVACSADQEDRFKNKILYCLIYNPAIQYPVVWNSTFFTILKKLLHFLNGRYGKLARTLFLSSPLAKLALWTTCSVVWSNLWKNELGDRPRDIFPKCLQCLQLIQDGGKVTF